MKVGGIYVDGSRRISLNMLVEVGIGSRLADFAYGGGVMVDACGEYCGLIHGNQNSSCCSIIMEALVFWKMLWLWF